jgi:hypothetical protein
MAEIIPRWEWRTFGTGPFGAGEDLIRASGQARTRQSTEVYILSAQSMNNTKVRDGLMDIKTLEAVDANALEQWNPILKAEFPLAAATLEGIFAAFGVPMPALARTSYDFDQYLGELVAPHPDLAAVDVAKVRHGYMIEGTIVEIAEVTFNGTPRRTVAVEHEDPALVWSVVRRLQLDGFENVNYLRAMKAVVGMA